MGRGQVAQRSRRVTKATLRYEQLCGQPIVSSPPKAHPKVSKGRDARPGPSTPGQSAFVPQKAGQDYKRHLPLSIPRPTRCTGSAQARRPPPPLPSPRRGSSCICHHPSRHARSPRVPSPPVGGDLVSGPLLGLCLIRPPRDRDFSTFLPAGRLRWRGPTSAARSAARPPSSWGELGAVDKVSSLS
jgi:hypothetical protein